MINILVDLTRELLNSGVFNHLPDNEIARLHWMIMQGQREDQLPLQPLLSYWYRGDFYVSNHRPVSCSNATNTSNGWDNP